jgi:hypothetical protein
MKTNTAVSAAPVKTETLTRDDFLELFLDVVNLCQPEHPYYTDPYPLSAADIEFSYCRGTSNTLARCGPQRGASKVFYALDQKYFQSILFEQALAHTVHEVTHITIGTQNEGRRAPMHPPAFWNEMAFHAMVVLDHIESFSTKWGAIDPELFRLKVVGDPNTSMVDHRSETVQEVRDRLQKWVGSYPANKVGVRH